MAVERHRRRGRTLLGAAILVAALAGSGTAAAALQPLPVVDLFSDDRVEDVTVAAGPLGDAVVGWTGQNNPPATVLAAFRPGDGPFAPVEFLSTEANGEDPDFVFQPDGTVLAVWSHATVGEPGEYATRTPGGTFGPAQDLPIGERFADVAVDAAGNALAAWKSFVTGGNDIVVASRRSPGGAFEAPVTLSPPPPVADNFIEPRVAVSAPGEAVVAWQRDTGPDASVVEAAIGSVAGPAFGAAQPLASESAADASLSVPAVAIAPSGEAIVVWGRSAGGSSALEYAVRPPGAASFGPAQVLAPDAFGARVGFDASGTAIIAFAQGPAGARAPSAVVKPPGDAPGPIAPLGPAGGGIGVVSVGFDASGAGLVAWSRSVDADTNLAEAVRRPAGGPFAPAVQIADMGEGVRLAVATEPDGDAVAAWRVRVGPDELVLRVGGLDNVPDPPAGPGTARAVGVAAPNLPRCQGARATILATGARTRGTPRRDIIVGRPGRDLILGLAGADLVCGRGGNDVLIGGVGADRLFGGGGADRLVGGAGRDLLSGGLGRDRLLGGPAIDLLRGGAGRDLLTGGPGRDRLLGGPGLDRQIP